MVGGKGQGENLLLYNRDWRKKGLYSGVEGGMIS